MKNLTENKYRAMFLDQTEKIDKLMQIFDTAYNLLIEYADGNDFKDRTIQKILSEFNPKQ